MTIDQPQSTDLKPQGLTKDEKDLKSLITYLNAGLIYLVLIIMYQSLQMFSQHTPWLVIFMLMAPIAVSTVLLLLSKQHLVKKSKKALWLFLAACAVNLAYTLIIRFVLTNQGFSILIIVSLVLPALVLFLIYSLVKRGVLV